jgi:two-component system, OmpR family, phosphate regulon sensor histidine kinase PhoR
MWHSRTFWRLFLSYGVLWIGSVIVLGLIIVARVEREFLAQTQEQLRARAALVREMVHGHDETEVRKLQHRLEELDPETGMRITLIADNGDVVAESTFDPQQHKMESHADREEVKEAREKGSGVSVRLSTTVHQEMMYYALHTDDDDGAVRFVRVALPLVSIRQHVAGLHYLIWTTVAVVAVVGVALAFALARRQVRPLRELASVARNVAAGDYTRRVYATGHDETADLGRAFNHMSDELADQFARLEDERQQLRAILSGMVEGVVALDAEQSILFANDRAERLLEFSHPEPVGKKLWQVVRQRGLNDIVLQVLKTGEVVREEITWRDGTHKSLTVHAARLPGMPPRGAVLVVHDTTDLRRLERLRQEFVANVSHELKTPLAIIRACVETLQDGAVDDIVNRGSFLEKIADQSHRLHDLILDLLSLARIEAGEEVFELEDVTIAPLVKACLERHQARVQAKKQTLNVEGQPSAAIRGDGEAVGQILDNLVDNAVKYTPEGGKIRVTWGRENGHVMLEVADTGIGISEQDLPRIFERFYRVDKARSRELGGTGLGLSIVKHLAQAMHGSVSASSTLGEGTRFTVRLPAAE